MNRGRTTTPMQLPTDRVRRGRWRGAARRARREGRVRPRGEPTAMHSARASALEPAGSPPPLTPRISRPSDCVRSFVPPPTVPTSGGDGDRDVEVAVLHLGGRDGVRALDDLRLVLPGGEEHRGDDVGDVGVEPEARGLRGTDQVLACVEFRDRFGRGVQAFFDDLARDSNVGGDAPAAPRRR